MIRLDLPWPPSVNHYWRRRGGQYYVAREGKTFRAQVWAAVKSQGWRSPIKGDVQVTMALFPPDGRRRDIDNILKSLFDALATAGVYEDDSQIKRLRIEYLSLPGGLVEIEIAQLCFT